MQVIELIQKKRDKCLLNKKEINYLINKYVEGGIPDYQMAAFLMATYFNGMSDEELSYFTDAMLFSGEVISHPKNDKMLVDKHSTGGVGDKISIPLAPAVAACGLRVPMIAGRSLGHTGGTLDKLEAIPGFRCNITAEEYKRHVTELGCVIMGQTEDIAPADKRLYALRDVTGTVESIPLIASSIMSKKLAEGIDGLVLDVKFGQGAFLKEIDRARMLASTMVAIGAHMGKQVTALLTSMDQPLGTMIGNSLEIVESIEILHGRGPKDSVDLTIDLGAEMLLLGKKACSLEEGRQQLREALSSGSGFKKFVDMVKAQGGDEACIYEPERLNIAPNKIVIEAEDQGYIAGFDCRAFGIAAGVLGGGRCTMADEIDPGVGIEMHVKIGDQISKGQPICTIFAREKGIEEAKYKIRNGVQISAHAVMPIELIKERLTNS